MVWYNSYMIENLQFDTKNDNGPIRKTHCKYGHSLEDAIQKYAKNGTKNGRVCRTCRQNQNQVYRENYPEVMYKSRTNFQLRDRYGLESLAARDALLASQGNACAICGTKDCVWGKGFTKRWHIDHKHDGTANHRGILCAECNHTIGRAKDDPALLRKMADYIESYQ